jgi:hypothetical protein
MDFAAMACGQGFPVFQVLDLPMEPFFLKKSCVRENAFRSNELRGNVSDLKVRTMVAQMGMIM